MDQYLVWYPHAPLYSLELDYRKQLVVKELLGKNTVFVFLPLLLSLLAIFLILVQILSWWFLKTLLTSKDTVKMATNEDKLYVRLR